MYKYKVIVWDPEYRVVLETKDYREAEYKYKEINAFFKACPEIKYRLLLEEERAGG